MNLIDVIATYTGCDARTEPAFALSDNLPCDECGAVTLTAVVIDDDSEREHRVCVECFDA